MDILTLKLLLIFAPGIISLWLITHLVYNPRLDFKYFLVYSFIIGMICYALSNSVIHLINFIFGRFIAKLSDIDFNFLFSGISNESLKQFSLSAEQFLAVCITAILLALIVSFLLNKGWIYKLLNICRITNRDDCRDVWNKVFGTSSNDAWVIVHDHENKRMYEGRVYHHSDYVKDTEIFLKGVLIYDLETQELIERCSAVYITREHNNLTVIFPGADAKEDYINRPVYYNSSKKEQKSIAKPKKQENRKKERKIKKNE